MQILLIKSSAKQVSTIADYLLDMGHCVDELSVWSGMDYREGAYDLVLAELPHWDPDTSEQLRHLRDAHSGRPLILVSDTTCAEERIAAFEAGCDDVVRRSCDLDELLVRIRLQVRKHRGVTELIRVGPIRLYRHQRRVCAHGSSIDLTQKEFAVLEFLAARAGSVVSRTELMRGVWGSGQVRGSNVLDVYVARLRSKLEGAGAQLRTVRGVGYCLQQLSSISS